MANKRNLKKNIRFICGDIAGSCMYSEYAMHIAPEKVGEIIVKLAMLQEDTIRDTSFSFDKTPSDFENKHDYKVARNKYNRIAFATLRKQFNEQVQAIVSELNALIPEEIKQSNKAK